MANSKKRISELPPLNVASLDTTFVLGISGSTTYKISINNLTSSLDTTFASDLVTTALSSSLDGKVSTSSFNQYTASAINGTISGSSQLTSSFDQRYVVSGSITQTTWDNIANKPSGIVSQSTDLSSLNTFTASISTGSLVNRLNAIESVSGSWITESETGSFLTSLNGAISGAGQISDLGFVSGSYETTGRGIISSSANLVTTSSFNSYTASISTASLVTSISNLNSATSSYLTSLSGAISSSSQLTSSFDTRYTLSGSVQNIELPSNLVSGSSQLTSSYDSRYTLSGSVVSGTTPAGTISGSSQLTSSFDGRYTQTGSFNTLTASFNSFTASAQSVTTGSNSFNGTQTITGSLIITTGSFVASQILANTASLYLTSGSNMYVQNNGVVEITGSLIVSGSAAFNVNVLNVNGRSGDEGGEIQLAIPETNTTLQNRVTVDIWQNRLRIFEGSAGANGVYIDLSKPTGNNNEITYKASGIVNAGTFVQLDNIKATVTTSGQRGLSLATVSGTFACNIGGNFAGAVVGASGYGGTATITTTPSTSIFGWGFTAVGDMANYIITDTTNSRAYRIIIQIGNAFNNNLVSIERLH